ncbi:nitronate monooxygenase family protein [Kingella negevensis]|uniref:Nitronate monooxygenase n=1 Tax=Kingella negevensis TaxID=1522312 RepID=A0A238HIZ6_9NEIS|nr:nitronate monooxygenase family protein [Kingella negevensis]MDK4680404.1 nitronate monooxygenase family protein [Kingella negevensis]MDK4681873.1 nitronate monooxygenase family protein [Kingella negevensis]MDK4685605.1 nitronate monooxygenase family protein [Kingella negevensis]MDK4690070.1 nitronate monooxygenase family protein [Kingella negevensis]MDK4692584.1 nitronate monooxygenase family protein [Kingella negevensis]
MQNLFNPLTIRGKNLIPIVQGGMGVGISASSLSSAVARENGIGTIASVDLRHLHEDLLADSKVNPSEEKYTRLNRIALDREIQAAKAQSEGRGMIAVNVMKAVKDHAALVRQACESGADAIVMGAGLPLDLPDLVGDYRKDVALLPILSESRGVGIVLKRWLKKGVLPDAIVIEHPAHAAGHLGASSVAGVNDEKFDFKRVLEETFKLFKQLDLEREKIPLILAGGMANFQKVSLALREWGANAVQVGTAFAVTKEGDAHINFKNTLAGVSREQVVEFMSVAGLPARGVATRFLSSYMRREEKLQANAKADQRRCTQGLNCLTSCGLRDGLPNAGQFCIDLKLAEAFRGEVDKGLFFRGKDPLPFGQSIKSVRETVEYLLTGNIHAA